LWIATRAEFYARLPALEASLPRLSAAFWDWLDLRAGEPRSTQPAVEQFVPQKVNLDVIGGVHVRKCCYQGQEDVSR
ncbi:folate-binding protein, partial [Burkholderia pseudomallei]